MRIEAGSIEIGVARGKVRERFELYIRLAYVKTKINICDCIRVNKVFICNFTFEKWAASAWCFHYR